MNLTERWDGHMFRHAWHMLEKHKSGTQMIGLTRSVVLLTGPQWSIVRTKMERLSTFVQYKATVLVPTSIQLFDLKQTRLNWKEHKFLTGTSSNCEYILESGLWGEGLTLRSTRQTCFITLLNPQDSLSRQRTIEWTRPDHEPRMVLSKQSDRPDHNCIDDFNLRRAHNANLVFHQSSSDAIFCTTISLRAHWTRLTLLQVKFGSQGNPRLQSSWRRLLANELTCAHKLQLKSLIHSPRKKQKSFLYLELDETSLEFSEQINENYRFDQW